jgi:hypothetical protein
MGDASRPRARGEERAIEIAPVEIFRIDHPRLRRQGAAARQSATTCVSDARIPSGFPAAIPGCRPTTNAEFPAPGRPHGHTARRRPRRCDGSSMFSTVLAVADGRRLSRSIRSGLGFRQPQAATSPEESFGM